MSYNPSFSADEFKEIALPLIKSNIHEDHETLEIILHEAVELDPSIAFEKVKICIELVKLNVTDKQTAKRLTAIYHLIGFQSLIFLSKKNDALEFFERGLAFIDKNSLADNYAREAVLCMREGRLEVETTLRLCEKCHQILVKWHDYENLADLTVEISHIFADQGSFQNAYRLLNDMQIFYRENEQLLEYTKMLDCQVSIAVIEGDLKYARKSFRRLLSDKNCPEEIKKKILPNLGITEYRLKNYDDAKEIFEKIYNSEEYPADSYNGFTIRLNYFLCLRDMEDPKAKDILSILNQIFESTESLRRELPAETIFSLLKSNKILNTNETIETLLSCYIEKINTDISSSLKLHLRRGVRERHVKHMTELIILYKDRPDVILSLLPFVTTNAFTDWASMLEWVQSIKNSGNIRAEDKEALQEVINLIVSQGCPVSSGFREKYDDPFDLKYDSLIAAGVDPKKAKSLDYGYYWNELVKQINSLREKYNLSCPYIKSSQPYLKELFTDIQKKSVLCYAFALSGGAYLLTVCQNIVELTVFESDKYLEFYLVLDKYNSGSTLNPPFWDELDKYVTDIFKKIPKLRYESLDGFYYMSDYLMSTFPINALLITDENFRNRINKGSFHFHHLPIPFRIKKSAIKKNPEIVLLSNIMEDLKLTVEESKQISLILGEAKSKTADLSSGDETLIHSSMMADYLHVSKHCVPTSDFTDPSFVNTDFQDPSEGLGLFEIQNESLNSNLSLVFMNACNSGLVLNGNYHKKIIATNEQVSFQSVFMMNLRASVISSLWKVKESLGVFMSILFYKNLKSTPDISDAFSKTLVDLYNLTKEDALKIIDNFQDPKLKEQYTATYSMIKVPYPFRHPYNFGCFFLNSYLKEQ